MRYTLQTNKGKIDAGYLDNAMKKVRVGDLIIPTDEFLRFAGRLIRHPDSEKLLFTEQGEITVKFAYDRNSNPKKIIFGDYEIEEGRFGNLVDCLLQEGSYKGNKRRR